MHAEPFLSANLERMLRDPRLCFLSEGAGCHGISRGLSGAGRAPDQGRLIRMTLSEGATCGVAAGLAAAGQRVIVELIDPDGLDRAAGALRDAGSLRRRSDGTWQAPVVVLAPATVPALIPGLRAEAARTAPEAARLMRQAVGGAEPTLILLPADMHSDVRDVDAAEIDAAEQDGAASSATARPAALLTGPLSGPTGRDACTVLAWGAGIDDALAAAALDADREGAGGQGRIEVVAITRLAPLDRATILESVQRTGRVVIAGGLIDAEALQIVAEGAFWRLLSPPICLPARAADTAEARAEAIRAAVQQAITEGQ